MANKHQALGISAPPPPPLSSATLLNSGEKGKSVFYLYLKLFKPQLQKNFEKLTWACLFQIVLEIKEFAFPIID